MWINRVPQQQLAGTVRFQLQHGPVKAHSCVVVLPSRLSAAARPEEMLLTANARQSPKHVEALRHEAVA